MNDFWTEIGDILGAERYSQHAICLTNDPLMMFLYIVGDLTTFVSYFAIGAVLIFGPGLPSLRRPSMKGLYGVFIVLCGLSHLSKTVTLFWGVYRLDVFVTFSMAAVSAVTAFFTVHDALRTPAARRWS